MTQVDFACKRNLRAKSALRLHCYAICGPLDTAWLRAHIPLVFLRTWISCREH
jgi:hypothetical protein